MTFQRTVFKFALFSAIISLLGCSPGSELLERQTRTEGTVQAAALTNDGSLSLVATAEEGLRLFDNQKNTIRFNWQQEEQGISQIVAVAFSPDNSVALAASRMTLVLWSTESGEVLGAWRNDESFIIDVAVSNRGEHIVLARNDGVVLFFNPSTGRRLEFQGHSDRVNQVQVSANGRYVLSGGNDHQALLWNTEQVAIVHRLPAAGRVTRIALDANGTLAMVNAGPDTFIYHLVSGERLHTLSTLSRQNVFTSARFSPNSKYLLTGSASRQIELWSMNSGNRIAHWRADGKPSDHPPRAAVLALAFLPNQTILSESSAGFGERWQLNEQVNCCNKEN
ncbi:WD40 repeat domain-containing protein [Aliidiomarina celeris]|uniref:WD40 repeat domain-containing protein n=1 Tax=Aliidiomarina celeris TaxID=2249428 RepID=UPI000DEA56A5|nr:hypothetical protein [Aliidiomarina celeris]